MKNCKCGKNNWEWQLDDLSRSWIKCKNCKDNMFEKGVGVVLINWYNTSLDDWNLDDVLKANQRNGIVGD